MLSQSYKQTFLPVMLMGWFRILDIRTHFLVSLGVIYQYRQFSKNFIQSFQLHCSAVLG